MRTRSTWVFWTACLIYLVVGLWLALDVQYYQGDSLSRVSAARSVLLSRDPHLAAIGFVFTPLTALVQVPLTGLSAWFPGLSAYAVTAVLMSAPFMAGAAVQIHRVACDRGCTPWFVWTVTAVFALNPMIVYYGANGMSEAPFLFALCWAARRLIRWCSTDDIHDLALAGIALALAYLARYDALAVGGAVTVFVALLVRYRSRRYAPGSGWQPAIMDAILVAAPLALAFVAFVVTSWLVTGEWLAQFTSAYGNAAILEQSGGGSSGGLGAIAFSLAETVVLGPALPLLIPVVAVLAWRRRDLEPLVPFVVFGAVLGFAALSYARGMTFPFLRFYICAIPLLAVWVVQLAPRRGLLTARRPGPHAVPRTEDPSGAAPLGAVLLVCSLPVTFVAMGSPTLSQEQHALRTALFPDDNDPSEVREKQRQVIAAFSTERRIAEYLDAMDLPPGSVLMDTVYGFAIFSATERPETFVIPSDSDFTAVLNRPSASGVEYILTVPNEGRGTSDAVNRRYPTIYETGSDIAVLELEIPNDGADQPDWRLFRVLDRTSP
ncbi:Dolichyl-phosphate-mannose-protein mannosyltransferase [Rhodococcus pyridinivorans]|uniref:glycosyltransferase family 39 protein n=1 Tax=Rhodococcus pyridinivorans TaxID=103816 RepID=UPI000898E243|nr:glycosyltransferase family 39 protein [Rhodococcus pyridinivorans]SEC22672.1 Dolichyl-phosphate-mannose-protein mannosyltransferase [Rhodococcus pyridinivorans]